MFVVAVQFTIHPDHVASFHEVILRHAHNSRTKEVGCRQFDVSQNPKEPNQFFLYEVYDDAAAFEVHRQTDYFGAFSAQVAPMVLAKDLRLFERISA